MKILVFTGGLGNQMFAYAFYLYLKRLFPQERFYGLYGKKLSEHYGLEIDKWFKVSLPRQPWWVLPVTGLFYLYKQCVPNSKWLDLNQEICKNPRAIVFFPFKFTKKYIPDDNIWLEWKVDESGLSEKNRLLLSEIRSSDCCFVHVRRGDYLSPTFKSLFEGCCMLSYYQRALKSMKEISPFVKFVCFSDDIQWVKQNLELGNRAVFVDWNSGTDSPLDMYLMSQCRYGIMANSTFSYWGARLGRKKKRIYYPQKWWNHGTGLPDIFPNTWVKI